MAKARSVKFEVHSVRCAAESLWRRIAACFASPRNSRRLGLCASDCAPRTSRGQSLVETIVACGIIVTAVCASLTLSTSAIRAEGQSEAMVVAGNLAREGIESVRSIRDSNWLAGTTAGNAWDAGLSGANDDYTGVPVFDPVSGNWSVDFAPNLISDDAARVYRYTAADGNAVIGLMVQSAAPPASSMTVTSFRRLVTLDPLCDNGVGGYSIVTSGNDCGARKKIGIRVTSLVQWNVGTGTKQVSIEERMFDWH
jgi:hypothetical protein